MRGLAQSVAKEFKEQDIHVRLPRAAFARCAELSCGRQVSHVIVDAMILTERWRVMFGDEWWEKKVNDETHRVHPVSIAKVRGLGLSAGWRADRGGKGVCLFG